jgi:hypothetical protein
MARLPGETKAESRSTNQVTTISHSMVGTNCATQIHFRRNVCHLVHTVCTNIANTFSSSSSSLLIPIPPDIPAVWDTGRIRKLLAPSQQVLEILHESITSGEQKEFALRIWEKARSEEPWILAQRSLSRAYERWKKPDIAEEDDGKTGSA